LLDQNPEWLAFLVPAYPVCPGKEAAYKSVKGLLAAVNYMNAQTELS